MCIGGGGSTSEARFSKVKAGTTNPGSTDGALNSFLMCLIFFPGTNFLVTYDMYCLPDATCKRSPKNINLPFYLCIF